MKSPYEGKEKLEWGNITEHLVFSHPLMQNNGNYLTWMVQQVWNCMMNTQFGQIACLKDLTYSTSMISGLFHELFAKFLSQRHPELWKTGNLANEKDLVYIPNSFYSFEIKMSGQKGQQVFGNKSYCSEGARIQKQKSGYYLIIHFYQSTLCMIRFGWIDFSDWKPQKSSTGQQASLFPHVYDFKLRIIQDEYQKHIPIEWVFSQSKVQKLKSENIFTLDHLLNHSSYQIPTRKWLESKFYNKLVL